MKITYSIEQQPFESCWLRFELEDGDDISARAGSAQYDRLLSTPVVTELVSGGSLGMSDHIHPDLLTVAALLVCGQTRIKRLNVPNLPSYEMCRVVKERFGIDVISDDGVEGHSARRRAGSLPGLAFSGGIDSCAALLLLPRQTVSVFMRRSHLEELPKSMYKEAAALDSLTAVATSGRAAVSLRSNVEVIRQPMGFPVDWSNSLPLVLNADALEIGSISFGTVLESAGGLGKYKYTNLSDRTIYSRWAPIFEVAGIDMSLPVSGLSEVLTSKLVREHGQFLKAQSCVRGEPGKPCGRCFKCFRKSITEAALSGDKFSSDQVSAFFRSQEIRRRIVQSPIHHEIGLAWALSRIPHAGGIMEALGARAKVYCDQFDGLDFLERPFLPNIEAYVPVSIRASVIDRVVEWLGEPNSLDISLVQSWDVSAILESPEYIAAVDNTVSRLAKVSE